MAYVPVPKDLSKIKTKLAFNLTKRQLICFSAAASVGLPAYLLTRGALGNSAAMLLLAVIEGGTGRRRPERKISLAVDIQAKLAEGKGRAMSGGRRCSISNRWPPPLPTYRTTA